VHIEYDDAPLQLPGTDVVLDGVRDEDVAAAKALFLKFSQERKLESTQYCDVLERSPQSARVHISGVYANDEPNFLFAYNITSLTKTMKKKRNREPARHRGVPRSAGVPVSESMRPAPPARLRCGQSLRADSRSESQSNETCRKSRSNSPATIPAASGGRGVRGRGVEPLPPPRL